MHKLLAELLKHHLPSPQDQDRIRNLLSAISDIFDEKDKGQKEMENSIVLVSKELTNINKELTENLEKKEFNQRRLEEVLIQQSAILDATPEGIISFLPGGKIDQINKAACEMLLGRNKENIQELSAKESFQLFLSNLKDSRDFLSDIQKIKADNSLIVEGAVITTSYKYLEYHSRPQILQGKYIGRVWCFRDVTDTHHNQALLKHHAYHDSLTALPNRSMLFDTIKLRIKNTENEKHKIAILFIDLDEFKKINDTSGHKQGDRCLIEVSNRLLGASRHGDILGRLGGDEFLLITEHTDTITDIEETCDRIIDIFEQLFKLGDMSYALTASIGISIFPQDGHTPDELIRKADMAMYQAKQKGKNTFHFYDSKLEQQALHRVSIENQLREAIQQGQLLLHYQPKICLKTLTIEGVEALIRWRLPNGKVIYPDAFISIAENTGLIRHVTHWVLETACRKLSEWKHTPFKDTSISVNITAIDFADRTFIDEVSRILSNFSIDNSLLHFELTESVFFDDIYWVKQALEEFKAHGIKLSIDDFGTGYSSFGYLKEFNIDYLKIDRSFVQDLHQNDRSLSIVKSIIDIGTNLGMEVIAEGVENDKDIECLVKNQCHYGQGFYFSKPLPEDKLITFIGNWDQQIKPTLFDE